MSDKQTIGHSEFTPYPDDISRTVHKRLLHTVPEYTKLHGQLSEAKTENLILKARVGEMEEALGTILDQPGLAGMERAIEKALAATGIETLAEVEKELGVLGQVEWGGNSTMKTCCPDCATEAIDHTKTCELSAWIERLKIKRDRLNKALEELG